MANEYGAKNIEDKELELVNDVIDEKIGRAHV